MSSKIFKIFILIIFTNLFLQIGCQAQSIKTNSNVQGQTNTVKTEKVDFPSIGNPKKIANGILVYEVKLRRENQTNSIWVYLPEKPTKEKISCVLIAPAGSRLIDGASVGEGSRPEHLPYVKAGFAVVAYDIDGEPKGESEESTIEAATAFKNSNAGL